VHHELRNTSNQHFLIFGRFGTSGVASTQVVGAKCLFLGE